MTPTVHTEVHSRNLIFVHISLTIMPTVNEIKIKLLLSFSKVAECKKHITNIKYNISTILYLMYMLKNTLFLHAKWCLSGWLDIPRKSLHLVQINITTSKNPGKYVKNIFAGNLRSFFSISFSHQIPKSNLSESWSYWRNAHWRRRVAPVSSVHSLPLQSRDGTLSYHMYSLWDLQEIAHYINYTVKCL